MKSIFKDIFGVLKNNFRSIVLFELIYRIISVVLYVRISKILIGYLMDCSGYSYMTLKNIGDILKTPVTYPVIVLLVFVAVLFAGFEMAVLHTGFRVAAAGSDMKIIPMVFAGFKRFIKLLSPSGIVVLMVNAMSYLVMQMIPFRSVLMSSRRISDIFAQMEEFRLLKAVCVFVLIALIAFVVYNAFVGCYKSFGCRKTEVFRRGHSFWRNGCCRIGGTYFVTALLYIMLYALVYVVVIAVMMFLVVLFAGERYEIVLVDVVGRYVKIVLAYFASVVSVYAGVGVTVAFFYHYNENQRKKIIIKKAYDIKPRLKKWFVAYGVVVALGTVWIIGDTIINGNLSTLSGISVMSHRGDSSSAPENTLPAIEIAIENLADYVEIDVHETKDGEIVVIHDASLKRTTGVDALVKNMTYMQIRELDAGAYFSREYAGTKIPTLKEVLDVCKSRINVNIEIKSAANDEKEFIKKIVDIVKEYNMEEQCIFQSSNYTYLKEIKANDTSFQTGLIIAAGLGNYFDDGNVDFFSVSSAYINSSIVSMAGKHGKRLYAWTVNSYDELMRMKSVGVDGVITDKPLYAKEILDGNSETRSLLSYIKMHMK